MDVFDLLNFERVASVDLVHQPGEINFWTVDATDSSRGR
jgi:hypothetical protein